MDTSKFKPLQEYLDSIPEPKWWQFKTRFLVWWSNLTDWYQIRKIERERRKKGSML